MTVSKRSRREDFLLPVNIKAGNSLVKRVLCKVYLPAKVTDDLHLDFYPTSRQAQKLESIRKFVLKGRLRLGDDVATEIHAGEVYSHGVGTAYWGSKIREDTMSADPTELTVTHINGDGEYIPSDHGPSPSSIRNKLVHGRVFRKEHHLALFMAEDHLRWSVERMILAVLGWPSQKSRVSPKYLANFASYTDWKARRLSVSK